MDLVGEPGPELVDAVRGRAVDQPVGLALFDGGDGVLVLDIELPLDSIGVPLRLRGGRPLPEVRIAHEHEGPLLLPFRRLIALDHVGPA